LVLGIEIWKAFTIDRLIAICNWINSLVAYCNLCSSSHFYASFRNKPLHHHSNCLCYLYILYLCGEFLKITLLILIDMRLQKSYL
uniref:Uncharacterized protein n=1 Tax=Megaselia scalaris TaxID=36166 RepID=T1H3B7_MEGSC